MAEARENGAFMVEELRRERQASALNLPGLKNFIDGGEFTSQVRKNICKVHCAHFTPYTEHCALDIDSTRTLSPKQTSWSLMTQCSVWRTRTFSLEKKHLIDQWKRVCT